MTRRDSGSSCAAIPGPRRRETMAWPAVPTRHSWRLVVRKVLGASSKFAWFDSTIFHFWGAEDRSPNLALLISFAHEKMVKWRTHDARVGSPGCTLHVLISDQLQLTPVAVCHLHQWWCLSKQLISLCQKPFAAAAAWWQHSGNTLGTE